MSAITACPRCQAGQILRDLDGVAQCLQCGYEPERPAPLPWVAGGADYPARQPRLMEAS